MVRPNWIAQSLLVLGAGLILAFSLVGGFLLLQTFFPNFVIGSQEVRVPSVPPYPSGKIFFLAPDTTDSDTGVWTVSTADGKARLTLPLSENDDSSPSWSPDGNFIAFTMSRSRNSDIYIMQKDGRGLRQLTNTAVSEEFPVWMPDDQHIRFFVRQDDKWQIEEMRTDGKERKRLTKQGIHVAYVLWSPDRTRLALWNSTQEAAISIITASGDTIISSIPGTQPTWSPDSSQIAFIQDKGLVTMQVNGGQMIKLSTKTDFVSTPDWSPNGDYIAFVGSSIDTSLPSIITILELSNSHISRIEASAAPAIGKIEWSPNNQWLLYQHSTGPGSHSRWEGVSVIAVDNSTVFSAGGGIASSWVPQKDR